MDENAMKEVAHGDSMTFCAANKTSTARNFQNIVWQAYRYIPYVLQYCYIRILAPSTLWQAVQQ